MSTPDRPTRIDGDRLEELGVRLEVISVVLEAAREELADVRAAGATAGARSSRTLPRDRHGLRAL